MADPYATRTPDLSGRPAGPPPWEGEVTGRGGALIGPDGSFPKGDGEPDFLVVPCCGIGTLAPFAAVDPAMAVLLWIEHVAAPRRAGAANDLLTRLGAFGGRVYALKQGSVGGPDDRAGCERIEPNFALRSITAHAAPFPNAFATNLLPSNFSPRIAKKISPALIDRESVETPDILLPINASRL